MLEEIPIGGTYEGPRYLSWNPQKEAELIWVEALDKGNPDIDVPHRDRIMYLSESFKEAGNEILKMEHRFSKIEWSESEAEFIFSEYDRDKLWVKSWLFNRKNNEINLIHSRSRNDKYKFPGYLVNKQNKFGLEVFIKDNSNVFYINNYGATEQGRRPYLARLNLKTGEKNILFKSEVTNYTRIYGFTKTSLKEILIRKENKTNPPNFYLYNVSNQKLKQITNYKNPYPQVTNLKNEVVTYTRNDSVKLSGKLYFPLNYEKGKKYPLVIEAYPQEYTDKQTAGQMGLSENQFIYFGKSSVKYFALDGYMVLANASIPIIGNPETVNETFISQTIESVKSAIDYLDNRNIINPEQVGVMGHSYGAFMVANVLAHSNLCQAGIARSGAYNRTLTPFGFQSERRTLWEAPEFYMKISPFMHADKIKEPLLLIHGEEDSNSGTYPIQSKRMYQALKGNGGTAKLVILPLEQHGYYALKSNLHVLAESIDWFDNYLKENE